VDSMWTSSPHYFLECKHAHFNAAAQIDLSPLFTFIHCLYLDNGININERESLYSVIHVVFFGTTEVQILFCWSLPYLASCYCVAKLACFMANIMKWNSTGIVACSSVSLLRCRLFLCRYP